MFKGRASRSKERAMTKPEINIQLYFYPNWGLASRVIYNVQRRKVNPGHCHHSKTAFQRNEVCNWIWVSKQLSHKSDAIVYLDGHPFSQRSEVQAEKKLCPQFKELPKSSQDIRILSQEKRFQMQSEPVVESQKLWSKLGQQNQTEGKAATQCSCVSVWVPLGGNYVPVIHMQVVPLEDEGNTGREVGKWRKEERQQTVSILAIQLQVAGN